MDEEFINDLIEYIENQIQSDAERHYSHYIYATRFEGDSVNSKYRELYCKTDTDLIVRLEKLRDSG